MVTPEYVDTLGIRMVSGRNINDFRHLHQSASRDGERTLCEAVSCLESIHSRKEFRFRNLFPVQPRGKPLEWQIVGVYHNVRGAGFREDTPEINVPFAQSPWPQASMAIKTSGDPKNVIKSIAAAVNSVDPDLPLAGMRTVDEIVSESLAIDRFSVVLFASFGVLGLIARGSWDLWCDGVCRRAAHA